MRDTFRHCSVCGCRICAKSQNKSGLCAKCHMRRVGKLGKGGKKCVSVPLAI